MGGDPPQWLAWKERMERFERERFERRMRSEQERFERRGRFEHERFERHMRRFPHGHGHWHGPPRFRGGGALHMRLFWWFGFSILMMGFAAGAVFWLVGTNGPTTWNADALRLREFAASRFERVWTDPAARDELTIAVSQAFRARLSLVDAAGRPLTSAGEACDDPDFTVPVKQNGAAAGSVRVCVDDKHRPGHHVFLMALGSAGLTLWMASMFVARRIGRPLRDLTRVTREIGQGKLKSRARLGWRQPGELGALAESIDDMATRIEKQLADQRELVAAVSHEIRAPLSRLRVLTEILRGKSVDGPLIDKVEREIVEIDSLVGDLLASSRLEFSLVTFHLLDAGEIAAEALERAGLPEDALEVKTANRKFEADATLLARALANLLDNAVRHAGGPPRVTVRDEGADAIVFEVDDEGPGFSPEILPRAFQAFERGNEGRRGSTSLGLGLALVRRIAEAHGGAAWAENLPHRGARVAIRLARKAPPQGDSRSERSGFSAEP